MAKPEFAISEVTPGKLNAMVKNVMSQMGISDPNEAVRRINSGEWTVSQKKRNWHEEDGIVYLEVVSDGTTGPEWIRRLEGKGYRLSRYAKDLLNSKEFISTKGVVYRIAILKGVLFTDNDRVTKTIRAEATKRGFTKPTPEVACLIRELLSDEDIEAMGLWWIVDMHEPIKDSDGDPLLLGGNRGDEGRWLHTVWVDSVGRWGSGSGFAFVVPQVQS